MSGGVTIPSQMHQEMIDTFRLEYKTEFGDMDHFVQYTRLDLIEKYTRDIIFWKKRVPIIQLDQCPAIEIICAHAICTNAIEQMYKLTDARNITADVKSRVNNLDTSVL